MLFSLVFLLRGGFHGSEGHGGEGHGDEGHGYYFHGGYYDDAGFQGSGIYAGPLHWSHVWPLLLLWGVGAGVLWWLIRKKRR